MNNSELIQQHIDYHQKIRDFAPSTIKTHERILTKWHYFTDFRNTTILKTKGKHIIEYITHRRYENVINSTILTELCIIRSFYTFLSKHKHNHTMPCAEIPSLICETTDEQKYLTVEECVAFLNGFDTTTADGLRNYTIFALIWSTGLRTAELTALKWKDFDFDNESFRVRKGKGCKERQLFLNDRLLKEMQAYRETVNNSSNAPVSPAHTKNAATVKREKITALSSDRLREITRTHAAIVGLDKQVTPKTFRHTFATHMYEAGIPMDDLKEMMGHSC